MTYLQRVRSYLDAGSNNAKQNTTGGLCCERSKDLIQSESAATIKRTFHPTQHPDTFFLSMKNGMLSASATGGPRIKPRASNPPMESTFMSLFETRQEKRAQNDTRVSAPSTCRATQARARGD